MAARHYTDPVEIRARARLTDAIVDAGPTNGREARYFEPNFEGPIYHAGDTIVDGETGDLESISVAELRAMAPALVGRPVLLEHSTKVGPIGLVDKAEVQGETLYVWGHVFPLSTMDKNAELRAGMQNETLRDFSLGWDVDRRTGDKYPIEMSLCHRGYFAGAGMKRVRCSAAAAAAAANGSGDHPAPMECAPATPAWGVTSSTERAFGATSRAMEAAAMRMNTTHGLFVP
jgi:hypothetical protein